MKMVKALPHKAQALKSEASKAPNWKKLQKKLQRDKPGDVSSKLHSDPDAGPKATKKFRRKRRRSNSMGQFASQAESSAKASATKGKDETANRPKPLATDTPKKTRKKGRKKRPSSSLGLTEDEVVDKNAERTRKVQTEASKIGKDGQGQTAKRKKRRRMSSSNLAEDNTASSRIAETSEANQQAEDQSPEAGNTEGVKRRRRRRKRGREKAGTADAESDKLNSEETTEDGAVEPAKKKARSSKMPSAPLSSEEVRKRALERLKVAQFRLLNEDLYKTTGTEAKEKFRKDPQAFEAYHEGFEKQVSKWPTNPVDVLLESLKELPKSAVIADMGCGDAKIAQTLTENTVHSFDLVALNDHVAQCDMSKVPLQYNSVNVVVFCLSLMGTNLNSFILEANRILKQGGALKIAEVESRFDDVDNFVKVMKQYGFSLVSQDNTNKMFTLFEFKKARSVKRSPDLPVIQLKPCLYKKR